MKRYGGAVSLEVARALLFATDAGAGFPERDLITFLTLAVIFFTLVGQGRRVAMRGSLDAGWGGPV